MLVQADGAKARMGNLNFVICYAYTLPCEYVRDAKDDHTGDDVEEITESKDTHQLVEIVLLVDKPDDQTYVSSNTKYSNNDLYINNKG